MEFKNIFYILIRIDFASSEIATVVEKKYNEIFCPFAAKLKSVSLVEYKKGLTF